jgi:hypothetical protein
MIRLILTLFAIVSRLFSDRSSLLLEILAQARRQSDWSVAR